MAKRLTLEPVVEGLQPPDVEIQHLLRRRRPRPTPSLLPASATAQEEAGQGVFHILGQQAPAVCLPLRRVLARGAVVHLW